MSPVPPVPPAVIAAPLRGLAKMGTVKLDQGQGAGGRDLLRKAAKKACAGTVTAKLGRKVIAKRSYKGLKPGATRRLKLTLSKSGRKLVAKVKRGKKFKLTVTATVKDAAGKGATAKRTVSVRR